MRLVIGTRPEAIKLAPLVQALAARGIKPRLILTGQHPRLDPVSFGLGEFEAEHLHCAGLKDPREHALAVATRMADRLTDRPGLIVVQGDTSSAFGGALAADALGIPLAHVEAGLRTHDMLMPWPEEEFRVSIDARSDLLFAPTKLSAANLRAEDIPGIVHVTGNTGIDAILAATAKLPRPTDLDGSPRLLVTCHRRESWGEGFDAICSALIALAQDVEIDMVLHPNPRVAESMRGRLADASGIRLHPPRGHREMLLMLRSATITLSDSGGIQEEAAALGTPLLVLRDKTERPEAIATGNMILVGTRPERIIAETRRLLADPAALAIMARPAFPYGDGQSGLRIAAIIDSWLTERKRARSPGKRALR